MVARHLCDSVSAATYSRRSLEATWYEVLWVRQFVINALTDPVPCRVYSVFGVTSLVIFTFSNRLSMSVVADDPGCTTACICCLSYFSA
jgi:hypothetical protein